MNFLSVSLILFFGILLGFVFQDLLRELGVTKKRAYSFLSVFGLPFLAFLGFMLLPIISYGTFQLNMIESLYAGEDKTILLMMFCMFIGGLVRLGFYHFLKLKEL